MKTKTVFLLILIILTVPATWEFFKAGGFTSHDLTHHVVRQIAMDKILSQSQFPPGWVDYLNKGYGYPLFIFNYPLPSLFGEIYHKLGLNYLYSVKAVLISTFFIGTAGMFFFLKEIFSKQGALLGALVYLYSPIRFLNTYVSAAVGSALALSIIPWVFYWIMKIRKNPSWFNMLGGGITLSLLILSHNVSSLIFSLPLVIFCLIQVFSTNFNRKIVGKFIGMFLLGFGLSAFFWIPSIFEKSYTRYDQLLRHFYQNQFPYFTELIRSPWGYGLSKPGQPGGISFEIGPVQLLMIALLIVFILLRRLKTEKLTLSLYTVGLFFLSLFLMLNLSKIIWDYLPLLYLVQFPARFLALSVFTASIAAALVFESLKNSKIFLIAAILILLYASRNHWHINQVFDPGENYYISQNYTSTSYEEHMPKWVGELPQKEAASKFEFLTGNGGIKINFEDPTKIEAEIEVKTPSTLRFNQVFFPGWQIDVSPMAQNIDYLGQDRKEGLPVINLNPGNYQIKAEFLNTWDKTAAQAISILSLIATTVIALSVIFKKWRN